MLDRWSKVLVRRPLVVLLVGVALTLAAGAYGAGVFGSLSQGGFDDPGSESSQALQREREALGNHGADVIAIYSSDELRAEDPEFQQRVEATLAGLPEGTTTQVITWYDTAAPDLVSRDGHSTQVVISLEGETQDEYLESFEAIEEDLHAEGLDTDLAGTFAIFSDVNERTEQDLQRAETISLPVVAILAILIFGSLVAAAMPVLVGAVAVVGALAVVRLLTLVTDVSIFSINVITLLGMGLAIDYALFVVSRFREELARRAGRRSGRGRRGAVHDHANRRPDRAVLRPDRRGGDVVVAGVPTGVPPLHGVRRDRGRAGRDAGLADRAAGDAAAARPPDRQGPRAAPSPGGRCRTRRLGRDRPRCDAPPGLGPGRRHRRAAGAGLAVPRREVGLGRPQDPAARRAVVRRHGEARERVRLRDLERQPGPRRHRAGRRPRLHRRRRGGGRRVVGAAGRPGRRRDPAACVVGGLVADPRVAGPGPRDPRPRAGERRGPGRRPDRRDGRPRDVRRRRTCPGWG